MQKHQVMCWCSMMEEKRTIMVRVLIIYKKSRKYTSNSSLFHLSVASRNTRQGGAARPGGPAPSRCSGPAAVRQSPALRFSRDLALLSSWFPTSPHHTSSAPENTSASATVAAMPADGDFLWSCPLIGWQASNREQLVRGWCISERLHFRFQGCLVNAPNPASGRKQRWREQPVLWQTSTKASDEQRHGPDANMKTRIKRNKDLCDHDRFSFICFIVAVSMEMANVWYRSRVKIFTRDLKKKIDIF